MAPLEPVPHYGEPPAHSCSVLIVEDEPELQNLIQFALEADGYEVAVVSNGRDALQQLRSTARTCLIILDLLVPVMSGRHFRQAQLADRSLAAIPVLIVSGEVEGAREARELGVRDFLRKPVDVDELRAAVKRIECVHRRPQVEQRTPRERMPDLHG